MPNADGADVIRAMRAHNRWAETPAVLFSATVLEPEVAEVCALPRVHFLTKPATTEVLEAVIAQALAPTV